MIEYRNETYINSEVVLDDIRWSGCTFRGCVLVFRGGGLQLEGNIIQDCSLRFDGAAEQTLDFMKAFAQQPGGAAMVQEATGVSFASVKRTFTLQ